MGSYNHDVNTLVFNLTRLTDMPSEGTDTNLGYIYTIDPFEKTILTKLDTEAYSKVGFKLTLDRHPVKHLLSYYFPSLIFVMVSWISFLVPPEIVAGRLGLLFTIFLVLVNIFNTITTNTPNADGKKHKIFHKPMFSIDRGFKMVMAHLLK